MSLLPARDANYRRGTIMGLTAAEAFMLICFILLLTISLWQRQTLDKLRLANEELSQVRDFHDSFTLEQRVAAVTYKEALEELGSNLQKAKSFEQLLGEAGGEARFRETLQTLRDVQDVPPNDVVDRVRLLDDRLVRQMAEATARLPEEAKRKLVDLTSAEQFQAMIEVAHSSPQALVEAVERLERFEELGLAPEEIATLSEALEAYELTGLSPQDVRRLSALSTEVDGLTEEVAAFRASGLSPEEAKKIATAVDQLRSADAQSGADIAAAIRSRAGELIAEMGGQILENGSVTFPEGVLFDPGQSALKPEFETVLSRFCQPWLEVLRDYGVSLRNVQIEGHASSEWNDAAPPVAFIKNLGLSQARAAVVFQKCLDYVADDALAGWARTRLAAVGYSSSRPVLSDGGTEDRERSRRVVFALDVKTADDLLIDELVAAPPLATSDGRCCRTHV
jgi:outer membrane protein OmpA-like peptidoglycan-associated protein